MYPCFSCSLSLLDSCFLLDTDRSGKTKQLVFHDPHNISLIFIFHTPYKFDAARCFSLREMVLEPEVQFADTRETEDAGQGKYNGRVSLHSAS